ncbi:MAG TPA: helix-turn-helix transcriptional regulator [Oligoflexus sp.]|uniref:helix-turn-helix domain-containing protein n=1 Tax=Oligoflexus sp. TaxID=1971216 RepID=UPI002D5A75E1|nr:helix-turn-helix transcriptional regulator [Oligoflexus sp.]HYX34341.1 helix-turn-helix transcriptional regulator [Oligoflexus sp.]
MGKKGNDPETTEIIDFMLGKNADLTHQKRPRLTEARSPIASAIKKERVIRGYTQKDLARKVGIGFDTLRRMEQGDETVSLALIQKVLQFLDLEIAVISRIKKISE